MPVVSDPDPFGENPFKGMPLFADLARMLQQQGPLAWDAARQMAHSIATGTDGSEANVDPMERIRLEQLVRVADLHVAATTGLSTSVSGRPVNVVPVTRVQWVSATLDAYRPLFERLAASLHPSPPGSDVATDEPGAGGDPSVAWLNSLMQAMAPVMLGMTAGSMVGHLSTRSFGQYDLPVPRPMGNDLLVAVTNLDEFGRGWSLDADDLRLWVCLHEVTHHAVLGVPHVRRRLDELIQEYVSSFRADGGSLESHFSELDPSSFESMTGIQQLFSDPEVLLGAVRSPAQDELLPRLEALVLALVGYVDHVMDRIGGSLISSYGMVTEAMRRRRVEAGEADRFVAKLIGIDLTQERYDRGSAFVDGIVDRAGPDGLGRLWAAEVDLPTPAEIDAPGLWLARIDLPH
jgi:putative hydrolase